MKKRTFLATLLVLSFTLTACGAANNGANETANSGAGASASPAQEVKKIIVGTGTQFPNVCFIDEDGKLTGFDVELVREIDKRLPEYEFEFQTQEFSSLLLSLETKKIDFVAHQMEKNPEREAKFLFNKEPYSIFLSKIAVYRDNTTINSIDDLTGKKVFTSPTSNQAFFLEQYNKDHNNPYEIVYSSGAANDRIALLKSGRVDATLATDFSLPFYPDTDGNPAMKTVGDPLIQSDVLFVLRKDSQELADKLDAAIKEVKADGTLSKLSVEWLGEDYTKPLDEVVKK